MKIIPLTQGKRAIVDDADFERVVKLKWQAHLSGVTWRVKTGAYDPAIRNNRNVYLGPFILRTKEIVDHKNGDPFDNRRENLRVAGSVGNARAFRKKAVGKTSKYRGVFKHTQKWVRKNGVVVSSFCWVSKIEILGKQIPLGRFSSEIEAAKAYDEAARKYFVEFACPNFKQQVSLSPAESPRSLD